MTDDFYRAFEERYRGKRELIKDRLRVYLPFVEPLKSLYPDAVAVDLGCGRGEWLELMNEVGIAARGVDLDDGMLAACRERGLAAEQGEAVAWLRGLSDGSAGIVSAFHVAEHMPFADVQALVREALRVLRPGGLLILETPNPENLVVGTSSFHFDPTHLKPLPPQLLSFLPEHAGFARVAVLRLQEPPASESGTSLWDVLSGVSPDFAVVAQAPGLVPAQAAPFDAEFAGVRGVGLAELAGRYDAGVDARIGAAAGELAARLAAQQAAVDELAEDLTAKLALLDVKMDARPSPQPAALGNDARAVVDRIAVLTASLGARLDAQSAELRNLATALSVQSELTARAGGQAESDSCEAWQAATVRLEALQAERDALRASWSWRITAPLRWAARPFMEPGADGSGDASAVPIVLQPLVAAMRSVLRDPQSSYRLNRRLMRYPRLHRWLVNVARRAGIYPGGQSARSVALRVAPAPAPIEASLPSPSQASAAMPRRPLTGGEGDIDELLRRVECELAEWRRQ